MAGMTPSNCGGKPNEPGWIHEPDESQNYTPPRMMKMSQDVFPCSGCPDCAPHLFCQCGKERCQNAGYHVHVITARNASGTFPCNGKDGLAHIDGSPLTDACKEKS